MSADVIDAPLAVDATLPWPGGLEAVDHCPVCADPRRRDEQIGVQDGAFGAAPGLWRLQRCLGCQALYLAPRPDRASIQLAYSNYYTHAAETRGVGGLLARVKRAFTNGYRNRVFATKRRPSVSLGSLLMPLFPARAAAIRREDRGLGRADGPGRRVLDVGCGNGQFLTWARELGWESYGIEMDSAAARVARERGVTILGPDLQELPARYAGSFDAVTLSHVIEHFYDPVDALRRCHDLLKPGGYLWIETPNTDSLGYELYGPHWRGLEAPRHLALFNFAALCWSLERAGFARISRLPPVDVVAGNFMLSAAMQLGRIAEIDTRALPDAILVKTRAAARRARAIVQADPTKAEFLSVIAHRPVSPTAP